MTTEIAFRILLFQPGVFRTLNVRRGTVGKWRSNYKKDPESISLNKKIELLQRAGFKMYQETRWVKINGNSPAAAEKEIDYLYDFPALTLLGKLAGMSDNVIRNANESIIRDPMKFSKIYKKLA